jgi:hypothetical protein
MKFKNKMFAALFVILSFSVGIVNAGTHGDWEVMSSGDLDIVRTTDANLVFGVACPKGNPTGCIPYVVTGLTCVNGGDYPMLINANENGVYNVTSKCEIVDGVYFFVLPVDLVNLAKTSTKIGVAFGLGGGKINVGNFIMNGYVEAIDEVTKSK